MPPTQKAVTHPPQKSQKGRAVFVSGPLHRLESDWVKHHSPKPLQENIARALRHHFIQLTRRPNAFSLKGARTAQALLSRSQLGHQLSSHRQTLPPQAPRSPQTARPITSTQATPGNRPRHSASAPCCFILPMHAACNCPVRIVLPCTTSNLSDGSIKPCKKNKK